MKNTHRTTDTVKTLTLLLSSVGDIADLQGKRYRITIPLNALTFDNHSGLAAYFYAITDFQLGNASTPNPGTLTLTYRGGHEYVGSDADDPRKSVVSRLVFDLDISADAEAFEDIPLIVKGLNAATDAPAAFTMPAFDDTEDPVFAITDKDGGAIPVGFAFEEIPTGGGSMDPYASQVEAEAGAASNKVMSPLRTAQAIAALGGSDGSTMSGIVGETVAVRDALRVELAGADGTAGRLYLTDATKAARSSKSWFAGFAASAATAGNALTFSDGVISGFTGLTPGAVYYAASTPGGITATAPANALIVGVALNSTTLLCRKGIPEEIVPDATINLLTLAGGPAFLLEANRQAGYSNTDAISTLQDATANNRDATQTGAGATYRTNIFGAEPAIRLGGAASFSLGNISAAFPTAATLFMIANHGGSDIEFNLYNTGVSDEYWKYSGNGNGYYGTFRTGRIDNYPTSPPGTGQHTYLIVSSASSYEVWIDGVSQGAQSGSFSGGSTHTLGGGGAGGNFNGDIALCAAWPVAFDSTQRTTLFDYADAVYGL